MLIILVALGWTCSTKSIFLLYQGPITVTPDMTSPVLSRWEGSPPSTCWQRSSWCSQPRRVLDFFATKAHCCLMVSLLSTRTAKVVQKASGKMLYSWLKLMYTGAWCYCSLGTGLYTSLCWTSQGSCLPISPACQDPSSTPTWYVSYFFQFYIICKLAERTACPILWSLIKRLSNTGPSIDAWGTPIVTDLQLDFVLLITTLRACQFRQLSVHLTIHFTSPYFISLWASWLLVLLGNHHQFPPETSWAACALLCCPSTRHEWHKSPMRWREGSSVW